MRKFLRRWLGKLAPRLEKIAILWSEKYLLKSGENGCRRWGHPLFYPLAWWFKNNLGRVAGSRVIPLKVNIPALRRNLSIDTALELARRAPKITVVECYCRKKHRNCDAPVNNCLMFGEPVLLDDLNPVVKENPDFEEIKKILEEAREHGLVHQALFFPDPNTVYCICNCCSCCCLSFQVKNRGYDLLQKSSFVIEINRENCVKCGKCVKVCPSGALTLEEELKIDREICWGCGLCQHFCEPGALNLAAKEEIKDYVRG